MTAAQSAKARKERGRPTESGGTAAQTPSAYSTQGAASAPSPSSSAASPASLDLPSQVLREVFVRVGAVRASLFRQLDNGQLGLDEQVRAIGFLQELDCDIDPAWYFLQRRTAHIGREMEAAVHAAIERMLRPAHRSAQQPHASAGFGLSSPTSPSHVDFSATNGDDVAPSPTTFLLRPQSNGHSASSSSSSSSSGLLLAAWNPFGVLLVLNPALSSGAVQPPLANSAPLSAPSSPAAHSLAFALSSAQLSSADPAAAASAVQHLVHRLCALLTQAIPDFLRLARLIATRQLTSAAAPHKATAAQAAAAPEAAPLQGVSAEDRRAIQALLDRLFHQFSTYVRLALFPVTVDVLQQWESSHVHVQHGSGAGADTAAAAATSASGPLRPPVVASSAGGGGAVGRAVDKASEHADVSLGEAAPSAWTRLPLLTPPSASSSAPLPVSTWQSVHVLLRAHAALQEAGLSSESLAELSSLRTAIVRWYTARVIGAAKATIEGLQAEEDWAVVAAREERGRSRRPHAAAQSLRRTALPGRFHALLLSVMQQLSAIPAVKANWIIKLIASPCMDCVKAFAHALHALLLRVLAEEDVDADGREDRPQGSAASAPPIPIRLLLLLSNLRYARSALLPSLLQALLALFPPSTQPVLTDAFARSVLPVYAELDSVLVQHFLRFHLLALHRHVREEAYCRTALLFHERGRPAQSTAGAPLRTRGAVVDVGLQLAAVHADLFCLCPPLIPQCMQALFAGVVQSVLWCCQHVADGGDGATDGADEAGLAASAAFWAAQPALAQLALLEAEFLERILEPFASTDSDDAMDRLTDLLEAAAHRSGSAEEQQQRRAAQLSRDLHTTAAMFHCFAQPPQPDKKKEEELHGAKKPPNTGDERQAPRRSDRNEGGVHGDEKDVAEEEEEEEEEEEGVEDSDGDALLLLDDDDDDGDDGDGDGAAVRRVGNAHNGR